MKTKCLIALTISILMCSCASRRIGDFTAISTKNISTNDYEVIGRFESKMQDDIKSCVDDCLEQGGGNIIINAVVEYRERFFRAEYVIKGDVCVQKKTKDR